MFRDAQQDLAAGDLRLLRGRLYLTPEGDYMLVLRALAKASRKKHIWYCVQVTVYADEKPKPQCGHSVS